MILWKLGGVFRRPKGIILNSNSPSLQMKAVFGFSFSAIGICQYPASKSIVENHIPAVLVPADAFFAAARNKLAELAASNRVPAIYSLRESVLSGGLMSYGNDLPDTYRLIGTYAARIIKGAKPADLPVLQPTKFEFVLNRKVAKELDLMIPADVLSIVDEVIE